MPLTMDAWTHHLRTNLNSEYSFDTPGELVTSPGVIYISTAVSAISSALSST
jgi:hypothetical protein